MDVRAELASPLVPFQKGVFYFLLATIFESVVTNSRYFVGFSLLPSLSRFIIWHTEYAILSSDLMNLARLYQVDRTLGVG